MLFTTVTAANWYTATDVEQRGPGDEYPLTSVVDPTPHLAAVEDWGSKIRVPDEVVLRNNTSYLEWAVSQLSNTIARKIDQRLMAKVEEAMADLGGAGTVPGHDWSNLIMVGPEADLTPSHELPSADIAGAQLAADMDELGVKIDCLVVHPTEAYSLRVGYAGALDDMLKSAGVELISNPRIQPGVGWAIQKGELVVGFEVGLHVDVIDDRETRSKLFEAYAVSAIGINKPLAAKILTGLAG